MHTDAHLTPEEENAISCWLTRERCEWPAVNERNEPFFRSLLMHGLQPLVWHAAMAGNVTSIPTGIASRLRNAFATEFAVDHIRSSMLIPVLHAFGQAGVQFLVLKGTALAHLIYELPELRPRVDVDLWISEAQLSSSRALLLPLGFEEITTGGKLITHQSMFVKKGRSGVMLQIDLHWQLSNVQRFALTLPFDECFARRVEMSIGGQGSFAMDSVDALIHSCIHRFAHHPSESRMIWLVDVFRLAVTLDEKSKERFWSRAEKLQLVDVIRYTYDDAQRIFPMHLVLPIPSSLLAIAAASPLVSRLDVMRADVRALQTWSRRRQWLRELAFPSSEYMRRSYRQKSRFLLPLLYVHRGLRGILRLVDGNQKKGPERARRDLPWGP